WRSARGLGIETIGLACYSRSRQRSLRGRNVCLSSCCSIRTVGSWNNDQTIANTAGKENECNQRKYYDEPERWSLVDVDITTGILLCADLLATLIILAHWNSFCTTSTALTRAVSNPLAAAMSSMRAFA